MRSQVSRHVLRGLALHHGSLPAGSILARAPALRRRPIAHRVLRPLQRRTFLGFFEKPPRMLKQVHVEPGWQPLIVSYNDQDHLDDVRRPSLQEMADGLRQFVAYKKLHNRSLTAIQVCCVQHALDRLSQEEDGRIDLYLGIDDLRTAHEVLLTVPRDDTGYHIPVAKNLYNEIRSMQAAETDGPRDLLQEATDLAVLLKVMSRYGASLEARDLLLDFWRKNCQDVSLMGPKRTRSFLWFPVLRGLAAEDREAELKDFVRLMEEEAQIPYNRRMQEAMTTFYAKKGDFEQMKYWFNQSIPAGAPPSQKTYRAVFKCAITTDHRDWALTVYQGLVNDVESLTSQQFTQDTFLVIYEWAVLLLGKGVEHIEQMIKANAERRPEDPTFQPDVTIINELIEAAMEKGDYYLAERFLALGTKFGIEPDRRSYSLQIRYRLDAKDVSGAFGAYRSLHNFDSHQEDQQVLNRLIRAMCEASSPQHEGILDIISYLEQQNVMLDADTVVSVCLTFLRNDEHYEVVDTLSLHTLHASIADRALISRAFVSYCVDRANSTARVWDAYSLLRQFFLDTTKEDRVKVMDSFFDRKRADMATFVFGHMRQMERERDARPTIDTYVRCLEGIGRCPDAESLKIVYNMVKMDTEIVPNTLLYNALMLAHTACDLPHTALEFWREISNSIEGPSYNSLEIAFRTFQVIRGGDGRGRKLWEKLGKMEVDVSPAIYTAYTACLASHGHWAEAKVLLDDMDEAVGKRPDPLTLAAVFDALPNDLKGDFRDWAQSHFEGPWSILTKQSKIVHTVLERSTFKHFKRAWKA